MKMAIVFVLALIVGAVVGCTTQVKPVGTKGTDNTDLKVDVLFTDKDGYTVKRFIDGGYSRYYVTPGPAVVMGGHTQSSGKSTVGIPNDIATAKPPGAPKE